MSHKNLSKHPGVPQKRHLSLLKLLIFVSWLFISQVGFGQVLINELMSSNGGTFPDEDGDYPDWIELYNPGDQAIDLEGWSLSDDNALLSKWQFPAVTLAPNEYLLVFASDKNRSECCSTWATLIDQGDLWSYKDGAEVQSLSWIDVDFTVDSTWQTGATGIGYDLNDEDQLMTEVEQTTSLFLRKTFTINDLDQINQATFHVDFDDAFIAYLNGEEIARVGIEGERPSFDVLGEEHEAVLYQNGLPSSFDVDTSRLIEGQNVLAVQVHNASENSSDLSITPFFSIKTFSTVQEESSPLLNLPGDFFHTNFKIKSAGEAVFLTNASGILVDSVKAVSLPADISYGRIPNQQNQWAFFEQPSPGAENASSGYPDLIESAPEFENKPGYFSGSETIAINQLSGYQLHYTLDGSVPTRNSELYTGPFEVDESTVIKARFYKEGYLPGPSGALSLIHESAVASKNLPFISISADPEQLFSEEEGLFNNMPGELEKPVYFEFFEPDGSLGFKANAGMKIFGNEPEEGYDFQQSLALFARAKYGDGSFDYRLFKEKNITDFEAFILRNNNSVYDLYDGVGNGLVQDILAVQAYQPVVVFINGEYYGVQNMMEKINEHYVASNFSVDADSVDLLNAIETDAPYYNPEWVMSGDIDHYVSMIDFMREHDLDSSANYEMVKTMIDIDNFATYQCAEIFLGNQDWPGNNMKWWRHESEDGRWRWIFFDLDAGLGAWVGPEDNTLRTAVQPDGPEGGEGTWPNPPWSTFILRSLLENDEFKNLFIATMCDLLATNFDPEESTKWVTVRENPVLREMPNHLERWDFDFDFEEWTDENDWIREFLRERPEEVRSHFRNHFDLGELKELQVETTAGGTIKVNNQILNEDNWTGEYFENLKIELEAIPDIGFKFDGWAGINSADMDTVIVMDSDLAITASFSPIESFERIVINEITYSDAPEGDWLELHNPTSMDINLSQWSIADGGSTYLFPTGTVIEAGQYLVLYQDMNDFTREYPSVNAIGELGFGLSKRGELLLLRNPLNEIIDSVDYKVAFPWPQVAHSISLDDPTSDNALPYHWFKSDSHKTPGAENEIVTGLEEKQEGSIVFHDPYPNPFTGKQLITFEVNKKQHVVIKLTDVSGNLVKILVDDELNPGNYQAALDASGLSGGLYMLLLVSEESAVIKRVISMGK